MTASDVLPRFRGCPVLVVGDLMLDEFVWGNVTRISPEAPVPVVEVQRRTFVAGGAANTATNIAALGGKPFLAGLLGDDPSGEQVCKIVHASGVDVSITLREPSRPTTTKTRVLAHSQQMLRVDFEKPGPMSQELEKSLLARIEPVLSQVRACVVSDYGKGVITPRFVGILIARCRSASVPVIVDPKGVNYEKYYGATIVKPNLLEAGKVLNRDLSDNEAVREAGRDLSAKFQTSILITQGSAGMSLFERDRPMVHIPAQAREVYDVTGAGDTVAGTMALTLASGGNLELACRIASAAAAVVVGKVGTATVSLDELRANIHELERHSG